MADDDDHLRSEDYTATAHGDGAHRLALRTHAHLVAVCPDCAAAWDELGAMLQALYRENLAKVPPRVPPALPRRDHLSGLPAAIDRLAAMAATLRRLRRRAKKQLSELRTLPAERRADRVRGAYRRFRTRQLAELLIEEARKVVRNAPSEAESFAGLVPLVLDWARGPAGPEWAPALLARAAGHRANALRVAGDLPAAERAFHDLRVELAARPLMDVAALAEVTSLEASLRIDQRRFGCAEELLRCADRGFEYVGDRMGLVRNRIKHANLVRGLGRPEEVLRLLEGANDDPTVRKVPYLAVRTVTARVHALCDLGRAEEARSLLYEELDAFEADPGPHAAALLRCLEGRTAFGVGAYSAAADLFQSSHDAMLAAGQPADAAYLSLYLAEALHAEGRTQDLRRLATRLIHEFRSRELAGEALGALRLLVQAIASQQVTTSLLVRLRRRVLGFQLSDGVPEL